MRTGVPVQENLAHEHQNVTHSMIDSRRMLISLRAQQRSLFFAAVHRPKFGGVLRQKMVCVRNRRQNAQRLLMMVVRRRKRRVLSRRLGSLGGGVRQTVVLLPLHSAVLEPDLDLSFSQAELVRDFYSATTCEIPIIVKFFLQLESLVPCVRCPRSLSIRSIRSVCTQTSPT